MDTLIYSVYEFNERVIGMPKDLPLQPLTPELKAWYLDAMHEELEEFEKAWMDQDLIGQVDAILDKIYFAIGRLKQMGLTREQAMACFQAVHTANMTKVRGAQAKRGNVEVDAVKPAEWISPENRIQAILFSEEA